MSDDFLTYGLDFTIGNDGLDYGFQAGNYGALVGDMKINPEIVELFVSADDKVYIQLANYDIGNTSGIRLSIEGFSEAIKLSYMNLSGGSLYCSDKKDSGGVAAYAGLYDYLVSIDSITVKANIVLATALRDNVYGGGTTPDYE